MNQPWLDPILQALRLGEGGKGLLLLVDQAPPFGIRDVVRGLLKDAPDLQVQDGVDGLKQLPRGSVVVLRVQAGELAQMNLLRPVFSERRLRVVLFCEGDLAEHLSRKAPDLFDFITQRTSFPQTGRGSLPEFVLHGLAALREAKGLGAWCPIAMPEAHSIGAYQDLLALLREPGEDPLFFRIEAIPSLWRLLWAAAEGMPQRPLVVTGAHLPLGFWKLPTELHTLAMATGYLADAYWADSQDPRPGQLAALLGLEPAATFLARTLLRMRVPIDELLAALAIAPDPGAWLAQKAAQLGLVDWGKVASGDAEAPIQRALHLAPQAVALRKEAATRVRETITSGGEPDPEHIQQALALGSTEPWPTPDRYLPGGSSWMLSRLLLRDKTEDPARKRWLRECALDAGDLPVSRLWNMGAESAPAPWAKRISLLEGFSTLNDLERTWRLIGKVDFRLLEQEIQKEIHTTGRKSPEVRYLRLLRALFNLLRGSYQKAWQDALPSLPHSRRPPIESPDWKLGVVRLLALLCLRQGNWRKAARYAVEAGMYPGPPQTDMLWIASAEEMLRGKPGWRPDPIYPKIYVQAASTERALAWELNQHLQAQAARGALHVADSATDAELILVLLSKAFLAEMPADLLQLAERQGGGPLRIPWVVPIHVEPIDPETAGPWGQLAPLPRDADPLRNSPHLDWALQKVVRALLEVFR